MAKSKNPEEDAERMLQKQAYATKRKPENREKNRKADAKRREEAAWCSRVKKKGSLMSPSY